jgi:putative adenylate-forming enzyme
MRFRWLVIWQLLRIKLWNYSYGRRVKALQANKWRRKRRQLQASPFYKKLAEQAAPLSAFPIMNKQFFMDNFDEINTVGIQRTEAEALALEAERTRDFSPMIGKITVGLSSGTSGNRGVFLVAPAERAQWVAAVLDRVIGLKWYRRKVAFFLRANSNLYDSVRSRLLHFEFFDLLDDFSEHVRRLNAYQPNILVAQPSLLLELARAIESGQLQLSVEKVISVAEVLYPEDRMFLEAAFGKNIDQVYQCTEGFLASTCTHGNLHFHEDFLIIEKKYLDAERRRFHPVITDLERTTQPVIRYELNDIIHELTETCPCGSPWMAIDHIEGRSDDDLRFRREDGEWIRIYPDFFRRAIISAAAEIVDYTLVQTASDELSLYVNGGKQHFEKAAASIQALLARYGIKGVHIRWENQKIRDSLAKLRRIYYGIPNKTS